MSARIAATCGAEQSDLGRPFIRLTCESLTLRLEYPVRSPEKIAVINLSRMTAVPRLQRSI
jgi:hypothetical protein